MNINDLTIRDAKELTRLFGREQSSGAFVSKNATVQIAVLQRGWVYVGRFTQEGTSCKLSGASCIRKWGTSEGLGELASKGPLSDTKLDKCPDILFHELTVINLMGCDESKWNL